MSTLFNTKDVVDLVMNLLSPVMHDKRGRSIAFAVLGVLHSTRLSVAEVGRALARVRGTSPKHGIKQVDRLLSNDGFDLAAGFSVTVPWIVASRNEIVVSLDWTDYDADGQCRIALNLITGHGRATPLVWKTVFKDDLKGRRNEYEDEVLYLLQSTLPRDVRVTVLADRGFGDTQLYDLLGSTLGWDFVIRFRSSIHVDDGMGDVRKAKDWVPSNGSVKHLPQALVTCDRRAVGVVCVKRRKMKDSWCLATSLANSQRAVELYGRRFTIEENFRDEKNLRFGFGLSDTSIGTPERRDRLLFVAMIAMVLLTLMGAAGERIGLDRKLRANTEKRRTHSLLRQGREYVAGALRSHWEELRRSFRAILQEHRHSPEVMGYI